MTLRLEFFDGGGTPLDWRKWTPRDGIVWVPRDAEQLRVTVLEEEGDAS